MITLLLSYLLTIDEVLFTTNIYMCLLFQTYFLNDLPASSLLKSVMVFIAAITYYHKLSGLNKTN